MLNSQTVTASTCTASPGRCCKEAASAGSTQGCQNHEDLGGSTSRELQDPFTHDKNYLGSAGPPDLNMKEKDAGISAIWGCLLPSGFTTHSWQGQGCSSSSCPSTGGDISQPHLGCCKCAAVCQSRNEQGRSPQQLWEWQKGSLNSCCQQPPWAQLVPEL